ncbi:beta-N-acetylhexosaminidase [Brevibacillus dissolubilis]|uniref:beta-N-acetylhexosaminidase n=1 Tax=Brevibacillus dissolubilis TaxID=1844116 RepID=UPI001115B707|nr:beta-N-acetylhexosaminidase [Brevibacillus dissolubilis]
MKPIPEMSLREKIGQMVMVGFHGTEPSPEIVGLLETYHLGGILYFSRNVGTPKQVYELSSALHAKAAEGTDIPLWIAIDQEGGMVARIWEGITLTPGNMAVGATRQATYAYELARLCGQELLALGINMNLAPCLDINNNPLNPVIGVRSYGETAELVGEMGAAAVRGYQEAGVSATVKHFPGHGDSSQDSHKALPSLPHSLKRLRELELVPFKQSFKEGADAVMTAHIVLPEVDPAEVPATISKRIITELLRGELGYEGVVMTDCLEMDAIAKFYGVEKAAVQAVEAGADIILVSHTYKRQVGALEALIDAVESGRVSEERIDESVERILALKQKRLSGAGAQAHAHAEKAYTHPLIPSSWEEAKTRINTSEGQNLVQSVYEQSITLVKDESNQLPINPREPVYVLWPTVATATEVDEIYEQQGTLGAYLQTSGVTVVERLISTELTLEQIDAITAESRNFRQIVALTYNTALYQSQADLINRLNQRQDARLIVVAVRNPFDLMDYPEVSTFLASYENRPLAMKAMADVLVGKMPARGRLPVTLLETYPLGHRLGN